LTIFDSFRGGVCCRCRLWWRFFRLYCRPKNTKKPIISINFMKIARGGSGPKHSAFCGGCFSINLYKSLFGTFSQKSVQKNANRRLFPSATKWSIFNNFHTIGNIYKFATQLIFNLIFFRRRQIWSLPISIFKKYFMLINCVAIN
jgi:hypothetical protein